MSKHKYFYDVHCHAFNLSHPNLMAFARRINLHTYLLLNSIPCVGALLSRILGGKLDRIMNLLSIMENDLGTYFLLMEQDAAALLTEGKLKIGGHAYDKIILTPLIMDFGSKGVEKFPGIHYSRLPQKPIAEQVFDLFYGIKDYSEYVLVEDADGEFDYRKAKKEDKLFEIYPFLGINTQLYEKAEIEKLLAKYFSGYHRDHAELYEKMGAFKNDVDMMNSNFFAGIKVYPPLGFDPWPEDGKNRKQEREKVECLYRYCIDKKIPVTSHCSDGGFVTSDRAGEFASPKKWKKAMEEGGYRELRLNLAHFGMQKKKFLLFENNEWLNDILDLIRTKENVYTDFSYRGVDPGYYDDLRKLIKEQKDQAFREKLKQRILFGSDFMINLLDIDSYTAYLRRYQEAGNNEPGFGDDKNLFCSANPERFLFG
jgi:hypothetical protein